MIFFLYGPDTYRSREKLRELKEKFVREVDPSSANLAVLDGGAMEAGDFRNAVSALSMFVRKRMVVVERLLESGKKDVQEGVAEYLTSADFPGDVIVVFWEGALEKSKTQYPKSKKNPKSKITKKETSMTLLPALLKQKYVQEFEPLAGAQLLKWIQAYVKELNGAIDARAAEELAVRVGSDLWRMDQEIQKLIAYRNGEHIRVVDVEDQVHGMFEEKIFALCDAIGTKESGRALALIESELDGGSHSLYLLTMMVRHFRILLMVREGLDTGGTEKSLATTLALHPFVLGKAVRQAALYTRERLTTLYEKLFSIERALKTSSQDPRALFTAFIAAL